MGGICSTSNLSVIEPLPSEKEKARSFMQGATPRVASAHWSAVMSALPRVSTTAGSLASPAVPGEKSPKDSSQPPTKRSNGPDWEAGAALAFEKLAAEFGRKEVTLEFVNLTSACMRERHALNTPQLNLPEPGKKGFHNTPNSAAATTRNGKPPIPVQPILESPTDTHLSLVVKTSGLWQQPHAAAASPNTNNNGGSNVMSVSRQSSLSLLSAGADLEDGRSQHAPEVDSASKGQNAETNSTGTLHVNDMTQMMGTSTSLLHRIGGTLVMESIIEIALHKMASDPELSTRVNNDDQHTALIRKALLPIMTGSPLALTPTLPRKCFLYSPELTPTVLRIFEESAREVDCGESEITELLQMVQHVCQSAPWSAGDMIEEEE